MAKKTKQPKTLKFILDDVSRAKQLRTAVRKLKEHDGFVLKTLLQGNFSSKIDFPFPPCELPPFEKNEKEVEVTKEIMMKLARCTTSHKSPLIQKEQAYISLLESVHEDDAVILSKMIDGELEELYPIITEQAVKKAFPGLI